MEPALTQLSRPAVKLLKAGTTGYQKSTTGDILPIAYMGCWPIDEFNATIQQALSTGIETTLQVFCQDDPEREHVYTGNEAGIISVFRNEVGACLGRILSKSMKQELRTVKFGDFQSAVSDSRAKLPDLIILSEIEPEKTCVIRAVGEFKSPWTYTDKLKRPFLPDINNTNNMQKKILCAPMGQLARYMDSYNVRYGFFSIYEYTIMVRRVSDTEFQLSPPISKDSTSPQYSLRECFFGLCSLVSDIEHAEYISEMNIETVLRGPSGAGTDRTAGGSGQSGEGSSFHKSGTGRAGGGSDSGAQLGGGQSGAGRSGGGSSWGGTAASEGRWTPATIHSENVPPRPRTIRHAKSKSIDDPVAFERLSLGSTTQGMPKHQHPFTSTSEKPSLGFKVTENTVFLHCSNDENYAVTLLTTISKNDRGVEVSVAREEASGKTCIFKYFPRDYVVNYEREVEAYELLYKSAYVPRLLKAGAILCSSRIKEPGHAVVITMEEGTTMTKDIFKAMNGQQQRTFKDELLKGMNQVFQQGLVHMDCRLENLLFDMQKEKLKLIDLESLYTNEFGLSAEENCEEFFDY